MTNLISPFPTNTALNPEQGGTGIDGDVLTPGQLIGKGVQGLGIVDLTEGEGIALDFSTPGQIIISSSGGLQYFTETQSTAAPNNLVNTDAFTATGDTANVDAAVSPKGTGALLSSVPTATATGGNKRGTYAVDLQLKRNSAAQVASGNSSTIAGGELNTASAQYSTVSGGHLNQATNTGAMIGGGNSNRSFGNYSVVCGGTTCYATADYSVNVGGNTNTATGVSSVALGGEANIASGSHATTIGGAGNQSGGDYSYTSGQYATSRNINGYRAWGVSTFAQPGNAQAGEILLKAATNDATPTILRSTLAAAGTTNQLILAGNSTYYVKGSIASQDIANGDSSAWTFEGVITRGANAASTALVAAIAPTLVAQSAGAAVWAVTVTADTVNGGLSVTVTGEAAKSINWLSSVETLELTHL